MKHKLHNLVNNKKLTESEKCSRIALPIMGHLLKERNKIKRLRQHVQKSKLNKLTQIKK